MKLCIVGVGLIGSSFALGLKRRMSTAELQVMGADRDRNSTALAQEIGAIDRVVSLEEGARTADVVVLATPVDHIQRIITDCLDQLSASAVLIDMGSTKQQIVDQVREHPRRGQYVAAHPIAGREKSGPAAARADLMQDHTMIVCDPQDSAPDASACRKHAV